MQESQDLNIVGKPIPKRDSIYKVTGAATYIHDLKIPGMLYGKILWSSIPHAKILNIDVSRAKRLPGVKAVLTGYDIPEIRFGFYKDNMPLKKGKVVTMRDEIAAVAAIDPEIAEEAISLIKVDYEPLPAIFDPLEAMQEGAPLIHEEHGTNVLRLPWRLEVGDLEEAKKRSAYIISDRFETSWVTHCCMGTSGCIAHFDPSGNLTLYSPTQIPYLAQREFKEALKILGIGDKNVRIIQPYIGGGFGSKLDTYPYEYIAILLAWYTKKPVKITFTREEEFKYTSPRQKVIIDITQGCDKDGKLTFREVHMILDNGGRTSWGATTPSVMMMPVSSLYKVPTVKYTATCVYTNNIYCQAMRGYGNPQATFAIECSMDQLAEVAGIDPLEFRLINANEPGEVTPQGFKVSSCALRECLEEVGKRLHWKEKRGRRNGRGVGVAALIHVGGGARVYRSDACGTIIKIDDFGRCFVFSGATDIGQGADTVIAQVVAEELGLPIEKVTVIMNDTDVCPWDVGVHASRTTFIACHSALEAARKVKKQILEVAALSLGISADDLTIKDEVIYSKTNPTVKIELEKVIRSAHFRTQGKIFMAEHFFDPDTEMLDKNFRGNFSEAYAYGAHGVEVEVDSETGQVKVLKYVAVHDVGKAINPMLLEGQIYGGVMMGLGYALTEEMKFENGELKNPNFLDYKILTAKDVPPIEVVLIEPYEPRGPFGAKGIGEPGCVPTAPAIANAIYDAVGIRVKQLPITPEKVLRKILNRKK